MSQKMTKSKLIDQIRAERASLEAVISGLTDKQMELPGVQGEWSVKDIIVHVTVWEQRGINWIRAVAKGERPRIPMPGYTWRDQATLNLKTYQENQDRPLQDVLADFQQSFPVLVKEIETITEERLDTTYQGDWTRDQLISGWHIAAWRFWHYRSHREHIQRWLQEQAS
ncbi:MAG: ClbS/DfsB family four-helix bundle protein [Candidatus Heimdallarchaeota archaeon]